MTELAKVLRSMADEEAFEGNFHQTMLESADTIERLQKEVSDLKEENRKRKDIGYQRDAALAEVERLKDVIKAEIHHQRGFK